MRKILDQSGVGMVLLSLTAVIIMGIAAIVTDVGTAMYEKQKLSNAIDAAALAAMEKIDESDATVINTAKEYAQLNGVDPNTVTVTIASDRKTLRVASNKNVNYFFARVIGFNSGQVDAQVGAKIAPITGVGMMRPLAVPNQEFILNQQYVLKQDAGDGLTGNYGALSLGGTGASVYRDNLANGYSPMMRIGASVPTETGNIAEATSQSINYLISLDPYSTYLNFEQDSPRIIIMPVVDSLDVTGRSTITIVGFAAFFLEGTQGSGGHTEVVGRFVKYVTAGDCDDSQGDYGLKAVKLTN